MRIFCCFCAHHWYWCVWWVWYIYILSECSVPCVCRDEMWFAVWSVNIHLSHWISLVSSSPDCDVERDSFLLTAAASSATLWTNQSDRPNKSALSLMWSLKVLLSLKILLLDLRSITVILEVMSWSTAWSASTRFNTRADKRFVDFVQWISPLYCLTSASTAFRRLPFPLCSIRCSWWYHHCELRKSERPFVERLMCLLAVSISLKAKKAQKM